MAKAGWVAAIPVEFGMGKDGTDTQHFEPGDPVPGAEKWSNVEALAANGYLVRAKDWKG